jgi:DNA-binding response OmpR family regulator
VFGDLELDRDTFVLRCNGNEIKLSNTEYKIMELLLQNPNKTVNKEKLIEKVWGWDNNADYNNAEVYISFLRKKLLALNSKTTIKVMRGVGYSLEFADG